MESRYCRQSLLKWILFWVRSSPRTFFGKFPISATKKGLTIPVTPNPIHLELFAAEIQNKVGVRAKLRDLGFRRWGGGGWRIILVVFVSFLKYLGNNIEDVFFPYSPQSARGQLRKIPWKISFCTITLKKSYTLSQKSARYQRKSAREPQFFFAGKLKMERSREQKCHRTYLRSPCARLLVAANIYKMLPFNLKKCIYLPENNKTVMVNVFFSRFFSEKVPMNKKKCPVTFPKK